MKSACNFRQSEVADTQTKKEEKKKTIFHYLLIIILHTKIKDDE
jgi:hypothetical protein